MAGVAETLAEARRAGLEVRAEGDGLAVRGPKRLAALAGRLVARKAAVLEVLRLEQAWAGLTAAERARFAQDVAAGDSLALVVQATLEIARAVGRAAEKA